MKKSLLPNEIMPDNEIIGLAEQVFITIYVMQPRNRPSE